MSTFIAIILGAIAALIVYAVGNAVLDIEHGNLISMLCAIVAGIAVFLSVHKRGVRL